MAKNNRDHTKNPFASPASGVVSWLALFAAVLAFTIPLATGAGGLKETVKRIERAVDKLGNDVEDSQGKLRQMEIGIKKLNECTGDLARLDATTNGLTENAKQLDDRISRAEGLASINSLPIGTIVAFVGEPSIIPNGWVLCDGQCINETHSRKLSRDSVHPFFWNKQTPKLQGMFLRGTIDPNAVSAVDGNDLHDHPIPTLKVSVEGPKEPSTLSEPLPPPSGGTTGVATFNHWHEGKTQLGRTTSVSNVPRHMNVYYILKIAETQIGKGTSGGN